MNGEVNYEKVLQLEFHRVSYILTIKSDLEGLLLQLEDKFSGQIWESYYEPHYIQQITAKTGSQKKYDTFLKMLINAITGSDQKLNIQLLTHQDLQQQAARKNGSLIKTSDPKLLNKRYLIISYRTSYQSALYPIPLDYIENPDTDRLRLTIRRLSQELQYFGSNPKTDSIVKQLSAVKHENQLLKSKLRSSSRVQSKENLNNNSALRQIQEENKQLRLQISSIKDESQELSQKKDKIIQEKDKIIQQLQNKLKKKQLNNNRQLEEYEQKFNNLSKQANQLYAQLQHVRQNQKKSQIKISNLQKELQKMLKRKNMTNSTSNLLNSPRKSDNGSAKSIKSNGSLNKKKETNNSTKKISQNKKNTTIYDSDTQSSRMRKNNAGVSPYRQSSRPVNKSKSGNKKQVQRQTAISKYSNISNLYNKDRDRGRSRSRSRSRSVKKQMSPPSDNMESSAVMTEGVQFSDNQDGNKQSETMKRLRNRNKMIASQKQKLKDKKGSTAPINPIQQRISSIAQLMRKFRNGSTQANNQD